MGYRVTVCALALLFSGMPCFAAELFYMDHDPFTDRFVGPIGPLVISGEIIPGDYDRLLSKIFDDEDRFLAQNKIILASDGGDVTEALKIAKLFKALYTKVIVGPLTGRCVSACFFIYAAAAQRETDGERLIGINRPYIVDSGLPSSPSASTAAMAGAAVESEALTRVRAFLRESAVPTYLVDEMFRHPSDDLYWLSPGDEAKLGYQSPSFAKFLAAQCAYAGQRSVEDLKQMLKCRDRATRSAAQAALDAAHGAAGARTH